MKAQKVYLVKDDSAYGIGLADEVKKILGTTPGRLRHGQDRRQGVQHAGHQGRSAAAPRPSSTAVTPRRRARSSSSSARAAGRARSSVVTASTTPTCSSATGEADVEGTVATCPCAPATAAKGTFVTDFQTKFGSRPAVYADVAYDLANIFLEAHRRPERSPGPTSRRSWAPTTRPARPRASPTSGRPTASSTRRRSRSGRSWPRPAPGRRTRRSRRPDPSPAVNDHNSRCGRGAISRPHRSNGTVVQAAPSSKRQRQEPC